MWVLVVEKATSVDIVTEVTVTVGAVTICTEWLEELVTVVVDVVLSVVAISVVDCEDS